MVDAFEGKIRSAVENAITKKLQEGILKLDSVLQSLPKEIPVDDNASLNVTFVSDAILTNSSIGFEINGLFTNREMVLLPKLYNMNPQFLVECKDPDKMLGISLDEAVFKSASSLYYDVSIQTHYHSNLKFHDLGIAEIEYNERINYIKRYERLS